MKRERISAIYADAASFTGPRDHRLRLGPARYAT